MPYQISAEREGRDAPDLFLNVAIRDRQAARPLVGIRFRIDVLKKSIFFLNRSVFKSILKALILRQIDYFNKK